ncbi:hypothetical protein C5708_01715 [Caulobacter sp. CCUG 60055]|nr:hypothetical protein [Caulobacter sp. CCUG 60055]MCI3178964.1 hypothetical protein [Caulobacter sp. CCUG 60055]
MKHLLLAAAVLAGGVATAQAASASPIVSLILKNQGAASISATDDLGIFSTQPKVVAAMGQGTGSKNFSGDVYSNVTVFDTLSNASCTFHTQSVYSSFYGHYQITATTPVSRNATDGSGRAATCGQTFTYRYALSGDYDSTMTVSFH